MYKFIEKKRRRKEKIENNVGDFWIKWLEFHWYVSIEFIIHIYYVCLCGKGGWIESGGCVCINDGNMQKLICFEHTHTHTEYWKRNCMLQLFSTSKYRCANNIIKHHHRYHKPILLPFFLSVFEFALMCNMNWVSREKCYGNILHCHTYVQHRTSK